MLSLTSHRWRLPAILTVALAWGGSSVPAPAAAADATAFPSDPPTIHASPISGPVVLDGKLLEVARKNCVEVCDFATVAGGLPANAVSMRVGYTPDTLYLAVECSGRTAKPVANVREHDGNLCPDDSIELYIAPTFGKSDYFFFMANAIGTRHESRGMDSSWNGPWQVAASSAGGNWRLEIAIPFSTLGIKPAAGVTLGLNLCRNDPSNGQTTTWCGRQHDPASWGRLVLGQRAFGLSEIALKQTAKKEVAAAGTFHNPGGPPVKAALMAVMQTPTGKVLARAEKAVDAAASIPLVALAPNGATAASELTASLAVAADGQWLYVSPPRKYPAMSLRPLQTAANDVALENSDVRMTFDANTGGLRAILHKPSQLNLRPRTAVAGLFSLEVAPFRTNSVFFTDSKLQTLQPDETTCRSCRVEGRTLRELHVFPCGLEVTISIELPEHGELSQWRIEIDNKPNWHPSQAMIVHQARFPRLIGLRTDGQPEKMSLAVPQVCGLLVPNPVVNLAKMPSYALLVEPSKSGGDYRSGRYWPCIPSMTWLDLSGPQAGVYLASHDAAPVIDTRPEAANDQEHKEMELAMCREAVTYPGETWKPGPCSVGIHGSGGWHWSADRYREWFYSTFKVRPLPQWLRESSGWVASCGGRLGYTWNDFPDYIRCGKPYGMGYIQKWCNGTGDEAGGGYAAFPFPNPYAGSLENFKTMLKRVHEMGGRVGLYHNAITCDPVMGKFLRQPCYRQKIPAGVLLPPENPYAGGRLASTKIDINGEYAGNGFPYDCYIDGYWWACWGAKPWMDYNYHWMAERWNKEYKLDACYLDSTGPANGVLCFHPGHGFTKPHGQGQSTLNFYQRMAEGTDPEYGICQEFVWDRLLTHGTHSLTCFAMGEFSEPALFRYVYPRYPLYCGAVNFFSGRGNLLDGTLPEATWPEFLAYVFLYGARFDHWGPGGPDPDLPRESLAPVEQEEKDLLLLRHAVHEDLNNDSFRDQIGLGPLPKKVFSRVFVRENRSAVLLTVFDLRAKQEAFALSLDLSRHGLKRATGAEIVHGGGGVEPLPPPVISGAVATVSIPANAGKTAAIRILTDNN